MKKTMITIAAAMLVAVGCEKRYESAIKTEKATVVERSYLPSSTGSDMATGFTTGGNVSFTSVSVTIPEVWAVVFQCEDHKETFALRGKDIYLRAKPGQEVTLEYVDEIVVRDGQEIIVDHHTKRVVFPNE